MNIAEIAKLAGVSRAAVSRYFNNGYLSREKRETIRRIVEETGYRPSAQAQMLRTRKTKMIGVIVPKMASVSIGRVVDGILSELSESGYQALLAVTRNNTQKELEYLHAFRDKQVDGIILAATVLGREHKRLLKELSVPVVLVGQQLAGYCCVFHDDYRATYDLTRLMLEKGKRNPGYISAMRQDKAVGEERRRGFLEAARDMGVEAAAANVVTASYDMASGYEKTGELLEKCGMLDCIICATDTMAAGAMQYLHEHKIKVPDQVIVAGQGDMETAQAMRPRIVTVHYFYEKSGEVAVQLLFELLGEKEWAPKEVKLGYYLVNDNEESIFGEEKKL